MSLVDLLGSLVFRNVKGTPLDENEGDANILSLAQASQLYGAHRIYQCNVPVIRASANNSTDTSLYTFASVPIVGGTMGLNSKLIVIADWDYSNTASVKSLAVYLGGLNISGPTFSGTSLYTAKILVEIQNLGSMANQGIHNSNNYGSAGARIYKTLDMGYTQNLDLSAKWSAAVASESITLIGLSIYHCPGKQ